MQVLVTGGAGYIGSHTCLELLKAGHQVVVVDNLANSKEESLLRVQKLAGKKLEFHQVDLLDRNALETVFQRSSIAAVIHFAALKAVGESVARPLHYYHNNVTGTLLLAAVMNQFEVRKLIFSSSATVYGNPGAVPIVEDAPLLPVNPYGRSKWMSEEVLRDLRRADDRWDVALLRYFNPIGAHPSGQIGEDPAGVPNNLLPYIAQVTAGRLEELAVFGADWPTPDGTGIRDYIHVVDLVRGHVKALEALASNPGVRAYNLGTGRGYSVLEVISAFEKASGRKVPYRIVERRPGDVAVSYADVSRAQKELGWVAMNDLEAMCADTWRWQCANPRGYE